MDINDEKKIVLDKPPRRLFLDLSSSCTGFAIVSFDTQSQTATIHKAGALWFGDDWKHGQKYRYIVDKLMDEFYVQDEIVDIVHEKYSVSFDQRGGCLVVPEMIGAIKAACYDVMGHPIGLEDMAPQSWRKYVGIKPVEKPEGGRDYKQPTIDHIDNLFNNAIPKKLQSNVTGNMRATPNDVYDAIGLALGWHYKLGIKKVILSPNAFDGGSIYEDIT